MLCTYKDCEKEGVGKAADTASHWLCDEHLTALTSARDEFYSTGDQSAMKRMMGHTIRAMGGAEKATERMKPAIEAGAKMIGALASLKSNTRGRND